MLQARKHGRDGGETTTTVWFLEMDAQSPDQSDEHARLIYGQREHQI